MAAGAAVCCMSLTVLTVHFHTATVIQTLQISAAAHAAGE